jgi:6-phosphogluconolactonase (cycloisomerase 2 family)
LTIALLSCPAGAVALAAGGGVTFGPAYVAAPGSPFSVGTELDAIAVNPAGKLVAGVDPSAGDVYMLSIDPATGALSPVGGSPFASGRDPVSVAFSPTGNLLATVNLVDGTVSVFTVSAAGALSAVPGSPFATGQQPRAVAFSPAGNLLAVANQADDTVSVFAVSATGALSPVPGGDSGPGAFQTGASPVGLAFNSSGGLLAVANEGAGTVSIFTVGPGGTLTPSAGSPLTVGDAPSSLAFSPSGSLLAVANSAASTVSMFTTSPAAAQFSIVPGSPFPAGAEPLSVAFSSGGDVLATADKLDNTTAIYSVNAAGSLGLEPGAPFSTGSGPHSVAFVPGSGFVATANTDGTVSVLEPIPPPTPTIVAPTANQSFAQGQSVQTRFYCLDSAHGLGIASCTDDAGVRSPFGLLDTKTLGAHTYTITAVSADGLTATASVSYTVTPAPPKSVKPPPLHGKDAVGHTITCGRGTWTGGPTSFTYQWARNGILLGSATLATYRIHALDAGSVLSCTVTGYLKTVSAPASSQPLTVPLHQTRDCPAASGVLTPMSLGALKLGYTTKQAMAAMKGSKVSHVSGHTQFCLSPDKIEVGFPDKTLRKLLQGGPASGHAVWMLTGNPHYSYSNVGIGMSLKGAEHVLNPGVVEQSKSTSIYFVRQAKSTIVIVANRQGVVQQIGIADNRVTANSKLMLAVAGSVTNSVAVTAPQ